MAYARSKTTGKQIIGSLETIPGIALIIRNGWMTTPGSIEPEYEGETEICWDGQTTDTLPRKPGEPRIRLFVDEEYNNIPETDIELYDDPDADADDDQED